MSDLTRGEMCGPVPVPRGSYCIRCRAATHPAQMDATDGVCDECAQLPWPISLTALPEEPEDVEGAAV